MNYYEQLAAQLDEIIKNTDELKKREKLSDERIRIDSRLKELREEIFSKTAQHQDLSDASKKEIDQLVNDWKANSAEQQKLQGNS